MSGTGNAAWGGGYVTDSQYPDGYFRQMSPHHIALTALLAGVLPPDTGPGLCYWELGCGTGFGAVALAASNPGWTVIGIDAAPAEIASARAMASAAGVDNATFIEADLTDFADGPAAAALPPADIVAMHGVWSWVMPAVQAGIVRLLARVLRPGGLAQVSFNALPAWSGALGLRQAAMEVGRERGGSSDHQAAAGLDFVARMMAAGARHLVNDAKVAATLGHVRIATPVYLAHEFASTGWRPCFFSEVAGALAGAKLDFVSSCHLLETVPEMMLTGEQRALLAEIEHPWSRETVKDLCLERALRQDLFVRGAVRCRPEERAARLGAIRLALTGAASGFDRDIALPVGTIELDEDAYAPILAALSAGPCRADALVAAAGRDAPSLHEMLLMLVGSHQAIPVAREPGAPLAAAARLNAFAANRLISSERLNGSMALASGRLGNAMPCTALDLFVHGRLAAGEQASPWVWASALGRGREREELDRLAAALEAVVVKRAPAWAAAGLMAGAV